MHDSFPSHGSSSAKASANATLTRKLGMRPEQPSRYTLAAVIHVLQQCWRRTRPWCCAHLLSPHTNSSPNFLATHHLSDVGSLSCRVTFKPVSEPLQPGVRFFQHPKLAPPSARLAACLPPRGSDTRFPRSVQRSIIGLGACFRPRCLWVTRYLFTRDIARIRYLLVQARCSSHFRLLKITVFITGSNSFHHTD